MKNDNEIVKIRRKKKEKTRAIFYIILIIIEYNIVLIAMSKTINNNNLELFGYQFYVITTDSMEPTLAEGDIVVVKECSQDEIIEGDIITYQTASECITHRVTEILDLGDGNVRYVTKGDNNNVEDQTKVYYENVQGKEVFVIKYVGKIGIFINNRISYIFITLIIVILFLHINKKNKKSKLRRAEKKIEDEKYLKETKK